MQGGYLWFRFYCRSSYDFVHVVSVSVVQVVSVAYVVIVMDTVTLIRANDDGSLDLSLIPR